MKKYIIYSLHLLIALTAFINKSNAQAKLGIDYVNFPDTVYTATDYTVAIVVKNKGNQVYTGTITTYYTDSTGSVLDSFPPSFSVTLNPGDTIYHSYIIQFNTPAYKLGNNIVVIWPTGTSSVIIADSAQVNVYVKDIAAAIGREEDTTDRFILFPNPAHDFVTIDLVSKIPIEWVRIFDATGQEVVSLGNYKNGTYTICTNKYKQGIYFVEFIFEDNTRFTRRFIKN